MKKLGAILPLRTRIHAIALAIGAGTWLAGFIAVYLVAPLGTGLQLPGAFAAFQPGSHIGNLLALSLYTLWGAGVLLVIRGSRFGAVASVLGAHGLIGIGAYYPAAVMGFGVAHLAGYSDEAPTHTGMAMGVVFSGGAALLLLCGILVVRRLGTWAGCEATVRR